MSQDNKRKIQYWVIPPKRDSEFVASMEDILETYSMPYNSNTPVVCMDEQPVQLLKEIRKSIAATKKHARRTDYEYERAGTACLFMFTEPLTGWRKVRARPRRTKIDWALELEELIAQRVHRRLRHLDRHKKIPKQGNGMPTYIEGIPFQENERAISIRENFPGEQEECLVITTLGLHVFRRGDWEFVRYSEIDSILSPNVRNKHTTEERVIVRLYSGEEFVIPVRGKHGRDAWTFMSFLYRVIADIRKRA